MIYTTSVLRKPFFQQKKIRFLSFDLRKTRPNEKNIYKIPCDLKNFLPSDNTRRTVSLVLLGIKEPGDKNAKD